MKSADASKDFASLVRHLRGQYPSVCVRQDEPSPLDSSQPLLALFVRSFLLWDSTCAKALQAMRRIEQAMVDFNDLRVCLPDELVAILGERYPRAGERALALRGSLNALYAMEHTLSLEHLARMDEAAQGEYLALLPSTPAFVNSRLRMLGLGGHFAPVDSRIHARLVEGRLIDKDTDCAAAAALLQRLVQPGEMPETCALLQAWSDDAEVQLSPSEPPRVSIKPVASRASHEARKDTKDVASESLSQAKPAPATPRSRPASHQASPSPVVSKSPDKKTTSES